MGRSSCSVRGSLEQGAAPSAPLCEPGGQTASPAWCPRAVGAAAGHLPAPARTKFSSNKSHQQVRTVQALRLCAGSSSPPRKLEFSCSSCPVLLLPLQDLDRVPLQRRDETPSLRSGTLRLNEFLWPSLELFVFSACLLPFRAASILGVAPFPPSTQGQAPGSKNHRALRDWTELWARSLGKQELCAAGRAPARSLLT